jgi:hypothetical protein
VAYEVLNQVESTWMHNAATVGAHLMERLQETRKRFPQIGFLRGRGLMIGMEFVKADGSPDGALADAVMEEAFRKGVLVLTCGASTIRLCPPLTLTVEQADEAIERFELAIAAVLQQRRLMPLLMPTIYMPTCGRWIMPAAMPFSSNSLRTMRNGWPSTANWWRAMPLPKAWFICRSPAATLATATLPIPPPRRSRLWCSSPSQSPALRTIPWPRPA